MPTGVVDVLTREDLRGWVEIAVFTVSGSPRGLTLCPDSVGGLVNLVERVLAGCPAAHLAVEMGVSLATAYKWLARYRLEGSAGLLERSSRPHRPPNRTSAVAGAQMLALRRERRLGSARIAAVLELNPATVHRVLVRAGMPRLAWLDRPTGSRCVATNVPDQASWSTST